MAKFRTLKLTNENYDRLEGLAKLHGDNIHNYLDRVLSKLLNDAVSSLSTTVVGSTLLRKLYLERFPAEGGNLIQTIKEVRGLTGLGLKEAKDLVDDVKAGRGPKEICNFDPDRCHLAIQSIQAAGGTVSIR